jgi:membrane peptidoglycan carboxypeptidase
LRLATVLRLSAALLAVGALAAGFALPFVGAAALVSARAATQILNTSCDVTVTAPAQTTTVYASDGTTVIARLFSQNREPVALSSIPLTVQDALVSTEDRTFYTNNGVDPKSIVRAALADSGGGDTQGGSTLTMQYVKQLRYYQATTDAQRAAAIDQTLQRKVSDAVCAVDLEQKYSKAQILDGYFNIAFFGENSYGIQVAAETYFGVDAAKLSVTQGATLVGLLRSPSELDPFQAPAAAVQRRNEVLANMVETGDVSAAQAAADQERPLGLASTSPEPVQQGCSSSQSTIANVGFFCDYVVGWLEQQGGLPASTLLTGGLSIITTLDAGLQNSGQRAVWNSGLDPTSATALVMPSVDPRSGAVTTMITSRHYGLTPGDTTLPLFTTGYAGAGSTYKYFTALAALEAGAQPDLTLTTGSTAYTVQNCPVDPSGASTPYTTHNAGSYKSTLQLKDALPESVNTYFVGLEDQFFGCNLSPVVTAALDLGMTSLNQPESAGSSQSIAQATISQHQTGFTLGFSPTAPLQLAAAYAAAANDGIYCAPTPIKSVTSAQGVPVAYQKSTCRREFSAQTARTLIDMMTADTDSYQGTAVSYFRDWYAGGGSEVASKTGTDNDDSAGADGGNGNSALWFVGVTPTLVSASALVNPTLPKATVTGLPVAVSNNGSDVFGAYAATFWLDAYGPRLQAQHWAWPTVSELAGVRTVPDVTGLSATAAAVTLTARGFASTVTSYPCGSAEPAGLVGYQSPQLAAPGSEITLCLSSGPSTLGLRTTVSGAARASAGQR